MRKVRDYNAELKALGDKAKALKERRVHQLGELVAATGADALDSETLAGALLAAASNSDQAVKEGWCKQGAAFFQTKGRKASPRAQQGRAGDLPRGGADPAR